MATFIRFAFVFIFWLLPLKGSLQPVPLIVNEIADAKAIGNQSLPDICC